MGGREYKGYIAHTAMNVSASRTCMWYMCPEGYHTDTSTLSVSFRRSKGKDELSCTCIIFIFFVSGFF